MIDPKPRARVRDPELLRVMHQQMLSTKRCALDPDHPFPSSLHHIHKHPRDDVRENLMWLCGDGTSGCHGLVEAHDEETMQLLVQHLRYRRPDFFAYLSKKLGTAIAADEWLRNQATPKLPSYVVRRR